MRASRDSVALRRARGAGLVLALACGLASGAGAEDRTPAPVRSAVIPARLSAAPAKPAAPAPAVAPAPKAAAPAPAVTPAPRPAAPAPAVTPAPAAAKPAAAQPARPAAAVTNVPAKPAPAPAARVPAGAVTAAPAAAKGPAVTPAAPRATAAGTVARAQTPAGPAQPAPVAPVAQLDDHVTYQYNALGRRDPFQSMLTGEFVGADIGGDAPVDVGGIKVVGIVWGASDRFALVEDGRGNSLVLRAGDKVMNGEVESLQRDAVVVKLTVDGQTQSVAIPLTRKGDQTNASR